MFHPILAIVLSAELGAYALGVATGKGFEATLGVFSTSSYPNIMNESSTYWFIHV